MSELTKGFQIRLNDRYLCRSGLDAEKYVISCTLSILKSMPQNPDQINMAVGGLNSVTGQQVNWLDVELSVGDKITLEVVQGAFDAPTATLPCDSEEDTIRQKLRYYNILKEDLKDYIS